MKVWLCRVTPYLHREHWGVMKAVYKAGYSVSPSSHGVAWGIGHPGFTVNFAKPIEDSTTTCQRCGFTSPMIPHTTDVEERKDGS